MTAFSDHGSPYLATIGYYPDGRIGEVFVDGPRIGSDVWHLMQDLAVLISIAIQFSVPLAVMRDGMGRSDGSGLLSGPHSLAGRILDLLVEGQQS
ncbi:MAG: hypothetical protein JWR75_1754 [Devosia sp.]|nr:hypothetical protein [Devosia sp.]